MPRENTVSLECSKCGRINYFEHKNQHDKSRLEKKKYCKYCKGSTAHKQTR